MSLNGSNALAVSRFEPIYLMPEGPAKLTEYGKRWMDRRLADIDRFKGILMDVAKLADYERGRWAAIERVLAEEGVPVAITSGISQYGMSHLIDHINGKTAFTMPTKVALKLAIAAPTSTTTGTTVEEATYTGYAPVEILAAGFVAATAATPSVAVNEGTITFAACTGGSSTLLGFMLTDTATAKAGNSLWYGTLSSTVISTTQTPATIANKVMELSMTGS